MVRNVGGNPCANILPHADFKGFYRVTYNESGMFTTLLKSFLSFIACKVSEAATNEWRVCCQKEAWNKVKLWENLVVRIYCRI